MQRFLSVILCALFLTARAHLTNDFVEIDVRVNRTVVHSYANGPPLTVLEVPPRGQEICGDLMSSVHDYKTFVGFTKGSSIDTPAKRVERVEQLQAGISIFLKNDEECLALAYMFICWWLLPVPGLIVNHPEGSALNYTWSEPGDSGEGVPPATVSEYTRQEVFRLPVCLTSCEGIRKRCPALEVALEAVSFDVPCHAFDFGDYALGHRWARDPTYRYALDEVTLALPYNGSSNYWYEDNAFNRTRAQCLDLESARTQSQLKKQCLFPLRQTDDGSDCAMVCPAPRGYSEETQESMDALLLAAGVIGVIASLLVVVTWMGYETKRQFPSRIAAYFAAALLVFSVSLLMSVDECKEGSETQSNDGSACAAQAFFFVFGSIAMSCWWSLFCVALFYMIVVSLRSGSSIAALADYEKYMHAFAWTLSLVCAVAPTAAGQTRFNPGSPLCFISSEQGTTWITWCFLVPHVTLLGIGFLLQCTLLMDALRAACSVRRFDTVKALLKFAIFVPLYLITLALLFAFFLQLAISLSKFEEEARLLTTCVAEEFQFLDLLHELEREGSLDQCPSDIGKTECLALLESQAFEACKAKSYAYLFPPGLDIVMRIGFLFLPLCFAGIFWCSRNTVGAFVRIISCGTVAWPGVEPECSAGQSYEAHSTATRSNRKTNDATGANPTVASASTLEMQEPS
ncbi:MAG: hypothetical protein MHM6MM_000853 [Cercozoa sp. M6MM]